MQNRISIGRNTIAFIVDVHPNFKFAMSNNSIVRGLKTEDLCTDKFASIGARGGVLANDSTMVLKECLADTVTYLPHIFVRAKLESGNFGFEKSFKKFEKYSTKDVMLFLESTLSFLNSCRDGEARCRQQIKEIHRQAEYFDNMIPLTSGDDTEGKQSSAMMDRTNAAGVSSSTSDEIDISETSRTSNCFICAEDVYLLGVTPWYVVFW
jgi:uncharacterized protein YuzB (UPF0349 family)